MAANVETMFYTPLDTASACYLHEKNEKKKAAINSIML